ncbi:MAG: phosphatidate cytidylyltransferase [Planctomycetaceae bacterium]|nr:phosphatidate cytidylyltransferase [Planctomycetaceae bacterium]
MPVEVQSDLYRAGILTILPAPLPYRGDVRIMILLGVIIAILAILYLVGRILGRQPEGTINPAIVRMFHQRVRAWWLMYSILAAGFLLGRAPTVILIGLISFWALREFITMTPTRRGDHRALFWVFFVFTPVQFVLVGLGRDYYPAYSIMIPVFASLLIPARISLAGDSKRFLERYAKIHVGLLICVYSLSYSAAVLDVQIEPAVAETVVPSPGAETPAETPREAASGVRPDPNQTPITITAEARSPAGLLFYLVLIVQLADVFQYAWGQLLGKRVIAPNINASRTWEGLIGGVATAAVCGVLFSWITPFSWWGSSIMAMILAVMGAAGGMTMSAIKRDRGVTDYGTLVQGHAGVLDRIDSLCFAAPIFYHLVPFIARLQ